MSCPYTAHLGGIDFNCEEDGNGIIWMWETLEGWFGSPPVRIAEQDKGPDGEVFTTARHLGRPFILAGSAVVPYGQPDLWFQAVAQLNSAANLVREPGLFQVDEPVPLQAYVRRNGTTRMERVGMLGEGTQAALSFEVPLKAEDPRKYAQTVTTNTALTMAGAAVTVNTVLTTSGTEDTAPTITIDGPAVNPVVVNHTAGFFVQWIGTVGAVDSLVLGYRDRTITLNGTDVYSAINPNSVWSPLLPGGNTMGYGRDSGTGTSTASIAFHEAYI